MKLGIHLPINNVELLKEDITKHAFDFAITPLLNGHTFPLQVPKSLDVKDVLLSAGLKF